MGKSYNGWLTEVDRDVYCIAGCSVHDLADVPLREWFDDSTPPKEAAVTALEYDGFY